MKRSKLVFATVVVVGGKLALACGPDDKMTFDDCINVCGAGQGAGVCFYEDTGQGLCICKDDDGKCPSGVLPPGALTDGGVD
jgi:hypothetical protein